MEARDCSLQSCVGAQANLCLEQGFPIPSHVNQKPSALLAMNSKLFSVTVSSKPLYSQHKELSCALERLKGPQLHRCSPMHSLTAKPEQADIVHADTVTQKHQLGKPFLCMDSRGAGGL